jgi:hypothetical protein
MLLLPSFVKLPLIVTGGKLKGKRPGGDFGLYCRLGGGMVLRRLKQSLQK